MVLYIHVKNRMKNILGTKSYKNGNIAETSQNRCFDADYKISLYVILRNLYSPHKLNTNAGAIFKTYTDSCFT